MLAELVMLLGVFSLGSIAIIASAARLSNIGRWANGEDFTYDAAMVPVWGAVEINVAIISGKSKNLPRSLHDWTTYIYMYICIRE